MSTAEVKKRFRQPSIFECFASSKKLKANNFMDLSKMDKLEKVKKIQLSQATSSSFISVEDSESKCKKEQEVSSDELVDTLPYSEELFVSQTSIEKLENLSQDVHKPTSSSLELDCSQNSDDLFPGLEDTEDEDLYNVCTDFTQKSLSVKKKNISPRFNRAPFCCKDREPLTLSSNHTIFFKMPFRGENVPQPFPDSYRDLWDNSHVRMPCSPESFYAVDDSTGKKIIVSRWEIIEKSLQSDIKSSYDLERAIMSYNSQYKNRWNFQGLHEFFTEVLEEEETEAFFKSTFVGMVKLALQLPDICTHPIPLLVRHKNHSLTLSQKQIGSLLANAFFCTFPRRNTQRKNSEYSTYPDINFNRLYVGTKNNISQRKVEKLKCLLNYFRRITTKEPTGAITFKRCYLDSFPDWSKSKKNMKKLHVQTEGLIEDDGLGMLQVDFANKFVGGGVLGQGCVQEEIRFVICPELIISRLFTEYLDVSEVLIITGCEQYNKYSGYGDSFTWNGNYNDPAPRDSSNRKCTQIVAMDALHFHRSDDQYKPFLIRRELNKAYCGFSEPDIPIEKLPAVATGNWGCGAFKGDARLKVLIQLLAASEAGRDVVYFTFGDEELTKDIENIYKLLINKSITVGELWTILLRFYATFVDIKTPLTLNLYEFIYRMLTEVFDEDTSSTDIDEIIETVEMEELKLNVNAESSSAKVLAD